MFRRSQLGVGELKGGQGPARLSWRLSRTQACTPQGLQCSAAASAEPSQSTENFQNMAITQKALPTWVFLCVFLFSPAHKSNFFFWEALHSLVFFSHSANQLFRHVKWVISPSVCNCHNEALTNSKNSTNNRALMVWEMNCWLFGVISYIWDHLIAKTPKQTSAVFPTFGCCMPQNLPIITYQMTSRKAQLLDAHLHAAATLLLLIHSCTILMHHDIHITGSLLPVMYWASKRSWLMRPFWKLVWAMLPNSLGKGAWKWHFTCYEATLTAPTSSPLTTGKAKQVSPKLDRNSSIPATMQLSKTNPFVMAMDTHGQNKRENKRSFS